MKPNQLQLASHQQSQRLKDLGFDWETRDFYKNGELVRCIKLNHNNPCFADSISAPTVALALKWLRDVKDINGWVLKRAWEFFYCIEHNEQEREFSTYELAESALLDAILTILEQKL